MADRVITAEALITAKDGTGDVFTKIAGKFQQLGKGAKVSADIEKMSKTLEQAQSQLRALDKLQSTRSGFGDARAKFNAQKIAVEQAAKAFAQAEKPTRALEAAYKSTQVAVAKASAEFERSKTAMLDAKHAAEGFGAPLAKIAAEQARLKGVVDATTRSIEHQASAEIKAAEAGAKAAAAHQKMEREQERRAHGIAHHGIINYALGGAAAAVSAHGIVGVGEKAIEAGAELQHERVASLNAGRTPEELKRYEEAAKKVAAKRPTASYSESMKTLLETTSSFGSVDHAIEHLDFMMRTASVLKAASGGKISESPGEMGQQFAKFFEMRGVAGDPKRFEDEGNEMVRAMAMTGGTFNPREMFNFAQQAKSSLRNYDPDYMSRVVPSLIGEQGGDRAGTAANAFSSVIMGKARDKKQLAKWMEYGLLDPKMVSDKKDSWSSGAVKGTDLALRNPLKWFEEVVLPAMVAKGVKIDDTLDLSKALGGMFRNQNSNQFANENAQLADRSRIHKDSALIDKTAHPDEMYQRNLEQDPTQAITALTASLENLGAVATSPAMKTAAGAISGLAGYLQQLAAVASDHPIAAMTAGGAAATAGVAGAGYFSYQLMNGFGLGASATALDGSAVALTNAAAVLSGKSAADAAKTAGAGLLGAAEGAGLAGAAFTGGVLVATAAGGLALAYGHSGEKNAPYTAADTMFPTADQEADPSTSGGRSLIGPSGPYGSLTASPYGGLTPPSTFRRAGLHFGIGRDHLSGAPHPALTPIANQAGGLPSLSGFSGLTATVQQPVPVDVTGKVQLEGQGNVAVTVKVIGGGEVVGQASSSSGNIKVSTGASMPGAKNGDGDK